MARSVFGLWFSPMRQKRYSPVPVQKASGDWRDVVAPAEGLKIILRFIYKQVLMSIRGGPPPIEYSDVIEAASLHRQGRWTAALDINNFFPSITTKRVAACLVDRGMDEALASQLADLMTLDGSLPQGAPTSNAIASMILEEFDRRVHTRAQQLGVLVSRYVDDIAISGGALQAIRELIVFIKRELGSLDLTLSRKKSSRPQRRGSAQSLFGLNLHNGRLTISMAYRNQLSLEVHMAAQWGITPGEREELVGKIRWVRRCHREEADRLAARLRKAPTDGNAAPVRPKNRKRSKSHSRRRSDGKRRAKAS